MYLILGLSGTGKTTAAHLLKTIYETMGVTVTIIHPYQQGKSFLEKTYDLPSGALDKPEYKQRLVPDLDGKPLVWEDGHCPTFQDLMVREFFFRQTVDPYFSSRSLKLDLECTEVGVCCGVELPVVHGVRKKEEIDVILNWSHHNTEPITVLYMQREVNKKKVSDLFLEENLEYLRTKDVPIRIVDNNLDLTNLKQLLLQVVS